MLDGQLGHGREWVQIEPERLGGPPAHRQRPAEHRQDAVAAQVAVPLSIPPGRPVVDVQGGAAHQLQGPAVIGRLLGPVTGQRPAHPGGLGVDLKVCPDVVVEQADLGNPGGEGAQV